MAKLRIFVLMWKAEYTNSPGLQGLEACVITSLPKLMVLCFIGGPFGDKSHPSPTNPEPLFDHWALHGPILLDLLPDKN